MNAVYNNVDSAINDADKLLRTLKKGTTLQVRSSEEKGRAKATALAWFNNYRSTVAATTDGELLGDVDGLYRELLSACDRAANRSTYVEILKALRKELLDIRDHALLRSKDQITHTSDVPPDFTVLITEPKMKEILANRWCECTRCVSSDAPLAATVMMGGLLEALLLARFNKEPDKSGIFKAAKAPKNRTSGKVAPLNEWTLMHYIDVSHELGWISRSAKDIGEVLRDYRNYIHPYKELSHGIRVDKHDARLFWEITKGILRQLIEKIK
jgi:hypothetical protein